MSEITTIENPLRFRNALERVAYARSRDSSRYNLNGIFLEREGEDLLLTATDGHRLAQTRVRDFPLPLPSGGFLLSGTQVEALRKAIHKKIRYCPPMHVSLTQESVAELGRTVDCLRLSVRGRDLTLPQDGEFPNYRAVIPKGESKEWTEVLGLDFENVAESAEILGAAHAKNAVTVKLTGEELVLKTHRELKGGSLKGVARTKLKGPEKPAEFVVNATYFAEALSHVGAGTRLLAPSGDGLSPILLRACEDLAVVMPVRP